MAGWTDFNPNEHTERYICGNVPKTGDLVLCETLPGKHSAEVGNVYRVNKVGYLGDYGPRLTVSTTNKVGIRFERFTLLLREKGPFPELTFPKHIIVKAIPVIAGVINIIENKTKEWEEGKSDLLLNGLRLNISEFQQNNFLDILREEKEKLNEQMLFLFCQAAERYSSYDL